MASSTPRRVDLTDRVPVRIRTIFNAGKGALLNVSSTGAYVATPMFLLPQAQVKLQIVLRDERRWVEAEAIVVWENRESAGRRDQLQPGYGLRFVSVPEQTRDVLDQILRGNGRVSAAHEVLVPPRASARASKVEASVEFDSEPEGPPYRLRGDVVDLHTPESQPGIFVLSYDRTQEARVGRTDDDLRGTIGAYEGEYAYFYCEIIESLDQRFARECELFHMLGGDRAQLDNAEHPKPPDGSELECPVCARENGP